MVKHFNFLCLCFRFGLHPLNCKMRAKRESGQSVTASVDNLSILWTSLRRALVSSGDEFLSFARVYLIMYLFGAGRTGAQRLWQRQNNAL